MSRCLIYLYLFAEYDQIFFLTSMLFKIIFNCAKFKRDKVVNEIKRIIDLMNSYLVIHTCVPVFRCDKHVPEVWYIIYLWLIF